MSDEPKRDRLPFEPAKKRQKAPKKRPAPVEVAEKSSKTNLATKEKTGIPADVTQRMARRMALFAGIPTTLGMATFVASYFVVTQAWFPLPNIAVVMVSMGFFGLGVLGLSYGVLSASWDEGNPGSKLGWKEFTTNWGRMTEAWRSAGQKN